MSKMDDNSVSWLEDLIDFYGPQSKDGVEAAVILDELKRLTGDLNKLRSADFVPPDVEISLLRKENEWLRDIGRRLLYCDERGQGVGWQEAMKDLAAALPSVSEGQE